LKASIKPSLPLLAQQKNLPNHLNSGRLWRRQHAKDKVLTNLSMGKNITASMRQFTEEVEKSKEAR
jgi:hypothetical protein